MKLTVSDDSLAGVMSRFAPRRGANLRIAVSESGVDIAANASGYLTLARWCMIMAHPQMEDHLDPDWLYAAYHLDDVFDDPRLGASASLEFGGALEKTADSHNVRFLRSERVGDMEFGA